DEDKDLAKSACGLGRETTSSDNVIEGNHIGGLGAVGIRLVGDRRCVVRLNRVAAAKSALEVDGDVAGMRVEDDWLEGGVTVHSSARSDPSTLNVSVHGLFGLDTARLELEPHEGQVPDFPVVEPEGLPPLRQPRGR